MTSVLKNFPYNVIDGGNGDAWADHTYKKGTICTQLNLNLTKLS